MHRECRLYLITHVQPVLRFEKTYLSVTVLVHYQYWNMQSTGMCVTSDKLLVYKASSSVHVLAFAI